MLAALVRLAASPEGAVMDVPERLAFKARSAAMADFCKDAVNDLVLGSGASAFRSDSAMQAVFRNLNMISVHAFFDYDASMEGYGRVVLGAGRGLSGASCGRCIALGAGRAANAARTRLLVDVRP